MYFERIELRLPLYMECVIQLSNYLHCYVTLRVHSDSLTAHGFRTCDKLIEISASIPLIISTMFNNISARSIEPSQRSGSC